MRTLSSTDFNNHSALISPFTATMKYLTSFLILCIFGSSLRYNHLTAAAMKTPQN